MGNSKILSFVSRQSFNLFMINIYMLVSHTHVCLSLTHTYICLLSLSLTHTHVHTQKSLLRPGSELALASLRNLLALLVGG